MEGAKPASTPGVAGQRTGSVVDRLSAGRLPGDGA